LECAYDWTRTTDTTAKVIGVVCILVGLAFLADGVLALFNMWSLFTGGPS
jgi:hypothetical protein